MGREIDWDDIELKFTPLEFETKSKIYLQNYQYQIKIYSVGV